MREREGDFREPAGANETLGKTSARSVAAKPFY